MSTRTFIWILVAVLAAVIIVSNARMQFKSAKNEPKQQHIESAFITVIAPRLEKKSLNEESLKKSLEDYVSDVSVYGVFYKKAEYSVIFTRYKKPFDARDSAKNLISLFSGNNFTYEESFEKINGDEIIKISGIFESSGEKYGVEALYAKRGVYLWQVLTVYPFSAENKAAAEKFINSAIFDKEIAIKEKNGTDKQK